MAKLAKSTEFNCMAELTHMLHPVSRIRGMRFVVYVITRLRRITGQQYWPNTACTSSLSCEQLRIDGSIRGRHLGPHVSRLLINTFIISPTERTTDRILKGTH